MFFQIVILLAVIAFLWALWSLKDVRKDKKVIEGVKKELDSGRVIFHHEHINQDSSSSSS